MPCQVTARAAPRTRRLALLAVQLAWLGWGISCSLPVPSVWPSVWQESSWTPAAQGRHGEAIGQSNRLPYPTTILFHYIPRYTMLLRRLYVGTHTHALSLSLSTPLGPPKPLLHTQNRVIRAFQAPGIITPLRALPACASLPLQHCPQRISGS